MRHRITVRMMMGLVALSSLGLAAYRPWASEQWRCPDCRGYQVRFDENQRLNLRYGGMYCFFDVYEHREFGRRAATTLPAYHSKHGRFPAEWWQLDMEFVGGRSERERRRDATLSASKRDGASWRPQLSNTIYVITEATASSCRIEGRDCLGTVLHTWRFAAGG